MYYDCPECGSDQTQKISAIAAEGTTHAENSIKNKHLFGTSTSNKKIISVSTTELAAKFPEPKIEPEDKFGWFIAYAFLWGVAMVLGLLVIAFFTSGNDALGLALWGAWGIYVAYFFIKRARKNIAAIRDYNTNVYPAASAMWKNGFYCRRCENTYIPGKAAVAE